MDFSLLIMIQSEKKKEGEKRKKIPKIKFVFFKLIEYFRAVPIERINLSSSSF